MAENNEVIAEIKVKYEDALRQIGELKAKQDELRASSAALGKELKELQKSEAELGKELKAGNITREDYDKALAGNKAAMSDVRRDMAAYTAEIKANDNAIRVLGKEVQDNIKFDREKEGSLNQLRAALSANTAAFAKLSEAERNSVKGSALQRAIAETTAKLKEEEEALGDHRRSVGDYEKANRSLRGTVRDLTEELARLKIEGKDGSAEYQQMAQKLGQLKDAMGDVAQETNNLGDDMGKLKGASEGISALVGGFGMINSAIGIGTSEGKLYNAVMRNLQITLTALASLTALQTALQKESALMTLVNTLREKARARAVIASTAATGKATIAQRLFNIVANANPYVLLLTGLTTLITLLVAFSANANTSAESQKRLNEQQKRFLDLLKEENEEARKVADQRKKVIEDEIRAMEAGGAKEDEIAAKRAEIREIERKAIEEEKERLSWEISAYDRNVDAINKLKTAHRGLSDTEERNQKIKRNLGDETKAVITGVYKYADALELVENRMETLKSATEQVEAVLERERAFNAQNRVDDAKQLAAQKEADAKATAEALKAREERSNKERELVRKAEDSAIALLEEGLEKQRKALKKGYARQVEDLQRQLTNDATKLTPAAKAAIEQLIRDLRAAEAKEMARLDGNELRRTIKVEEERIALKLEGVKKGADQEYQLRQQLLIQQERDEIAANRQRVESEQMDEADIRAKYRLLLDENDKARVLEGIERTKEAASLEWEGKLAAVRAGSEEEARIRVEMAQAAADRVRSLSGEQAIAEFGSIQAWKSAVIQADGEVNTSKQALQETIQETTQKQLDAASTVGGAMQELAESFAEDNAAMAGFAKALALFNIGLDTAKAIAAIPAMSAAGDPYTYALRVATAIATVMTSIAKARQVLSKEKEPKAPKFAEGGLVTGPGTGSSDSVPAMLSAGESVITAPATRLFAPLLSAINQVGGGVPISTRQVADQVHGEEMLARAFERALSRMPSPVVSVREITRVSNEVQVLENDAML